jgi:hypothetical protein
MKPVPAAGLLCILMRSASCGRCQHKLGVRIKMVAAAVPCWFNSSALCPYLDLGMRVRSTLA